MAFTDKTVKVRSRATPGQIPDFPQVPPGLIDLPDMTIYAAQIREWNDNLKIALSQEINTNGERVTAATAVYNDGINSLRASITSEQTLRVNGDAALAQTISQLQAVAGTGNNIFVQTTAPVADAINDLWLDSDDGFHPYFWSGIAWVDWTDTRLTTSLSTISTIQSTYATQTYADTKKTEAIVAAGAYTDGAIGGLSSIYHTIAAYNLSISAYATQTYADTKKTEAISAAAGDATSKVGIEAGARAQSDGYLSGIYTIKVDAGGHAAGMKITAISDPAGWTTTSEIAFVADSFKIYNGTSTVAPFQVVGGQVKITSNLIITASDVSGLAATATSTDFSNISGATKPENNATAGATWGTNLGSIPATLQSPSGDGLYLSGTYMGFYKSSAWTSYIKSDGTWVFAGDGSNYVSWNGSVVTVRGALNASDITTGTLSVDRLGANSIAATKLTVSTLSAISADLGTITAGNITLNTSGFIRGGQTDYNTGVGFFLGYSGGKYVLSIGDPAGEYLRWTGSVLEHTITAAVATADLPTYSDEGTSPYKIGIHKPGGAGTGYSVSYSQGGAAWLTAFNFPFTLTMGSAAQTLEVVANDTGKAPSGKDTESWNLLFL